MVVDPRMLRRRQLPPALVGPEIFFTRTRFLEKLSNSERLNILDLETLNMCHVIFDLIVVYKYLEINNCNFKTGLLEVEVTK